MDATLGNIIIQGSMGWMNSMFLKSLCVSISVNCAYVCSQIHISTCTSKTYVQHYHKVKKNQIFFENMNYEGHSFNIKNVNLNWSCTHSQT